MSKNECYQVVQNLSGRKPSTNQFPLVFFVLAADKSKKAETAAQMSS